MLLYAIAILHISFSCLPSQLIRLPKYTKSSTCSISSLLSLTNTMGLLSFFVITIVFVFFLFIFIPMASLRSLTFCNKAFNLSSESAIRTASSACLMLFIFLPLTLVPFISIQSVSSLLIVKLLSASHRCS